MKIEFKDRVNEIKTKLKDKINPWYADIDLEDDKKLDNILTYLIWWYKDWYQEFPSDKEIAEFGLDINRERFPEAWKLIAEYDYKKTLEEEGFK